MSKKPSRQNAYMRTPTATNNEYQGSQRTPTQAGQYGHKEKNKRRDHGHWHWDSDCRSDTTVPVGDVSRMGSLKNLKILDDGEEDFEGLGWNAPVPEDFVDFVREAGKSVKTASKTDTAPRCIEESEEDVHSSVEGPTVSQTQERRVDVTLAIPPIFFYEGFSDEPEACGTDLQAELRLLGDYMHWSSHSLQEARESNDTVKVSFHEALIREISVDYGNAAGEDCASPLSTYSDRSILSEVSGTSSTSSAFHSLQPEAPDSQQPASAEAQAAISDSTASHPSPDKTYPSSSDSSHTSHPAMDENPSEPEHILFTQVPQLRYQADVLRRQMDTERARFREMESGLRQEDQTNLKDFRIQLAEQPDDDWIRIDRRVAFAVHRMISGELDESGLQLENLRQSLVEKQERLGRVEAQLHGYFRRMERCLERMAGNPRMLRRLEGDNDASSFSSIAMVKHPSHYSHDRATEHGTEDTTESEDWQGEPEPLKIFDSSRYHEDYVKLKDLEGHIKTQEEQLNWLKRQEIKLTEDKERREGVDLHLSDENERLLSTLPSQIMKLEAELEEEHEELARLTQACMMNGIIDEDGEPVEEFSGENEGEEEEENSSDENDKDDAEEAGYSEHEDEDDDLLYPMPGRSYGISAYQQNAPLFTPTMSGARRPSSELDQAEQGEQNIVVKYASANNSRSSSAQSLQEGLLAAATYNAPSRASGPTQFAISANSRAQSPRGDEEPEVLSVDKWLFEKLWHSQSEVRLLATIVQATGAPLLEKTAEMVVQFWNSAYHGGTVIKKVPPESVASIVMQEGYDWALVRQMVEGDWEKVDLVVRTEQVDGSEAVQSDLKSLPDS